MATRLDYQTALLKQKIQQKEINKQQETQANNNENNYNWFQKFSLGAHHLNTKITKGILSPFEGMVDGVSILLAKGAELIGQDEASQNMQNFVKRDLTDEFLTTDFYTGMSRIQEGGIISGLSNEDYKRAYIENSVNVNENVGNVAQGIGNALGFVMGGKIGTGIAEGLGQTGKVATAIGQYAPIGISSFGSGSSEALNQGSNLNQAMGYGFLSGTTEVASEMLVGKVLEKVSGLVSDSASSLFNKVAGAPNSSIKITDNITKNGISKAIKETLASFTEEGLEEAVSDIVNPISKKLTYQQDKSYSEIFEENGGFENVLQDFLVGGLSGGLMGGASNLGNLAVFGNKGSAVIDNIKVIDEYNKQIQQAQLKNDINIVNELESRKQSYVDRVETQFKNYLTELQDISAARKTLENNSIENLKSNGIELNEENIKNALLNVRRSLGSKNFIKSEIKENYDNAINSDNDLKALQIVGDAIGVKVEEGSEDSFNPETNTITLKRNNINFLTNEGKINNDRKFKTLHELGHKMFDDKKIVRDTLLQNYSDEVLEKKRNKLRNVYENKLGRKVSDEYLDQEIANNELDKYFDNLNDFKELIEKTNSRGLKRLLTNYKELYKGTNKPDNYRKVIDTLGEAINSTENNTRNTEIRYADEREVEVLKKENIKILNSINDDARISEESYAYLKYKVENSKSQESLSNLIDAINDLTLEEIDIDNLINLALQIDAKGISLDKKDNFVSKYNNIKANSSIDKLMEAKKFYEDTKEALSNEKKEMDKVFKDLIEEDAYFEDGVTIINDFVIKKLIEVDELIKTKEDQIETTNKNKAKKVEKVQEVKQESKVKKETINKKEAIKQTKEVKEKVEEKKAIKKETTDSKPINQKVLEFKKKVYENYKKYTPNDNTFKDYSDIMTFKEMLRGFEVKEEFKQIPKANLETIKKALIGNVKNIIVYTNLNFKEGEIVSLIKTDKNNLPRSLSYKNIAWKNDGTGIYVVETKKEIVKEEKKENVKKESIEETKNIDKNIQDFNGKKREIIPLSENAEKIYKQIKRIFKNQFNNVDSMYYQKGIDDILLAKKRVLSDEEYIELFNRFVFDESISNTNEIKEKLGIVDNKVIRETNKPKIQKEITKPSKYVTEEQVKEMIKTKLNEIEKNKKSVERIKNTKIEVVSRSASDVKKIADLEQGYHYNREVAETIYDVAQFFVDNNSKDFKIGYENNQDLVVREIFETINKSKVSKQKLIQEVVNILEKEIKIQGNEVIKVDEYNTQTKEKVKKRWMTISEFGENLDKGLIVKLEENLFNTIETILDEKKIKSAKVNQITSSVMALQTEINDLKKVNDLLENSLNNMTENYEKAIENVDWKKIPKSKRTLVQSALNNKIKDKIEELNNKIKVKETNLLKQKELASQSIEEIIDKTTNDISKEVVDNRTKLEKFAEKKATFIEDNMVGWVNAQFALERNIVDTLKEQGYNILEAKYIAKKMVEGVRSSKSKAINLIDNGFIDEKGNKLVKGLKEIYKGMTEKDANLFDTYLKHKHNIDRMSIEERILPRLQYELDLIESEILNLENLYKGKKMDEEAKIRLESLNTELDKLKKRIEKTKNKPLFSQEIEVEKNGKTIKEEIPITAEVSKNVVKKLETMHPEFESLSNDIYRYNDLLLNDQLANGLLTENEYNTMKEYYPHYIPTYRIEGKGKTANGLTQDMTVTHIKYAKGGYEQIMNIRESMVMLTNRYLKASSMNAMLDKLFTDKMYVLTEEEVSKEVIEKFTDEASETHSQNVIEFNDKISKDKNAYEIKFYHKGQLCKTTLDYREAIGLKELQNHYKIEDNLKDSPTGLLDKMMKSFKGLVTDYNPFFLVRNMLRDLQDAWIYTHYDFKSFNKNYLKAFKMIKSNSIEYQLYKQYGGLSASMFDGVLESESKAYKSKKEWLRKHTIGYIQTANAYIEQIPRFAEFLSSLEHQKKNLGLVDYNLAVWEAHDITLNFNVKGAKPLAKLANRYLIPFFNAQIQGFYKIARKVNNTRYSNNAVMAYTSLITKCAILGIMPMILNKFLFDDDDEYQSLSDYYKENFYLIKLGTGFIKIPKGRMLSFISSLVNPSDKNALDYVKGAWDTLSPITSLRTIWQPFVDVSTNTTWYGGQIVSSRYDNVRPENQYDSETSIFGKAIGKAINYSPIKIDYLLQQYTGVIGDFVLPMTSTKGLKGIGGEITSSASANFYVDAVYKNTYSTKFYDLVQELNYQNKEKENNYQAKGQLKYLNKVKTQISSLNDKINEIQASNLSNAEKEKQIKVIQISINALYKQAIITSQIIRQYLDKLDLNEDNYEENYYLVCYQVLGAKTAFELMDDEMYQKATDLNIIGIDYDTYFTYYINTKGFDKEYKQEYINRMGISKTNKYLLYLVSGYSIPKDYKTTLASYIKKSNMSSEYKEKLLKKLI